MRIVVVFFSRRLYLLDNQAVWSTFNSTNVDIHKAGAYHFQVTAVLSLSVLSFAIY